MRKYDMWDKKKEMELCKLRLQGMPFTEIDKVIDVYHGHSARRMRFLLDFDKLNRGAGRRLTEDLYNLVEEYRQRERSIKRNCRVESIRRKWETGVMKNVMKKRMDTLSKKQQIFQLQFGGIC